METEEKNQPVSNRLLIAAFLVVISLPMLLHFFSSSTALSVMEKRKLARVPKIPKNLTGLVAFPEKFSAYIDDHFGFRKMLLTYGSQILYGLGIQPSKKVLIGKDGWMFLGHPPDIVEQYRGIDRFSEKELADWVIGMKKRELWLRRQGIKFFIIVAPNKHSIYNEFLPNTVGKPLYPTRLDQLVDYINRFSDLCVIDLRETMKAKKNEGLLYRKTDSHWTDLGGYIGSEKLIECTRSFFSNVAALGKDDYMINAVEMPGGDLAQMMNLENAIKELVPVMAPKGKRKAVEYNESRRKDLPDGLRIRFFKTDMKSLPSVIIFRDSFIWAMLKFITDSFSRTVIVHHQGMTFNPRIVLKEKPDIVIYELVERSLNVKIKNSF